MHHKFKTEISSIRRIIIHLVDSNGDNQNNNGKKHPSSKSNSEIGFSLYDPNDQEHRSLILIDSLDIFRKLL
jgi:hypothetical protein